jgi:RimJ/RimL family protein N-acetyltransferase
MNDLYRGTLVRLSAADPEELGKTVPAWSRDTEFMRLFGTGPARLHSSRAGVEFYKKEMGGESPTHYWFSIRALDDDRLLGETDLEIENLAAGEAFIGIGIYKREEWGKGYGTDAMKVALHYAFTELNLRRVSLTVFEYNPRAIRSYEKCGFQIEGRRRGALLKDGKRWDMIYMGILFDEWKELYERITTAS